MCFTVILADDEPQILEGIRDSVEWETLGFRVIATALNGKELLEEEGYVWARNGMEAESNGAGNIFK